MFPLYNVTLIYRSMCSLVSDQPPPSTQSPKRKFSFRFPHLSNHPSSVEKAQTNIGLNTAGVGTASSTSHLHTLSPNSKKKNFTEELKSIPDLQVSSLTYAFDFFIRFIRVIKIFSFLEFLSFSLLVFLMVFI